MCKKLLVLLLSLMMTSLVVNAQDENKDDKSSKGPREKKYDDRAPYADRMKMMMEKFRQENPEQAKELEALKESNPEEFRRKVRELLYKKFGEHRKYDRDRGGHWLREMQEKDPEKFKKLMELKEQDPEAFRKKMVEEYGDRFRKGRDDHDQCRKEIGEILKKYNEAASEEEKAKLKSQLRAKLAESFEKDLQRRSEKVERLAKYLSDIKKQVHERETNKESLINEQVEYLIQGKFRRDGSDKKDEKRD